MGWIVAFFFAALAFILGLVLVFQLSAKWGLLDELGKTADQLRRLQEYDAENSQAFRNGFTISADTKNPSEAWIGRTLTNRFRIVAIIGRGGMGVVYRAWDVKRDRYSVVKMPSPSILADMDAVGRFRRELTLGQQLNHPAIVPILAVAEEVSHSFPSRSDLYVVMEYLAGGSLKQRQLKRRGDVSSNAPSVLWHWLPRVAEALDYVHAQGLVHRDVKPDNILFDGLGSAFLSDFGVAKAGQEEQGSGLTRVGFAIGTPEYLAPENIRGDAISGAADQYSLAMVVFEVLAGRSAFSAPVAGRVLSRQLSEVPMRLDAIRGGLPASLVDAVTRGLRKDACERFADCRAFAEAVLKGVARAGTESRFKLMCPDCSRLLTVHSENAGREGQCPFCGTGVTISRDLQSLWLLRDRSGGGETRIPAAGYPWDELC